MARKMAAEELQSSVAEEWKWLGRSAYIADGAHVSMPDTPENRKVYPQPPNQQPGVGFPLARIMALLSLATGAGHDLEIAPYEGKGTGEKNLLRRMYKTFKAGDVVLLDSLFDDYFLACELRQLGVDLVAHAKYARAGSELRQSGPEGEILAWQRPQKPRGMTREKYRSYPAELVMRRVKVDARDRTTAGRAIRSHHHDSRRVDRRQADRRYFYEYETGREVFQFGRFAHVVSAYASTKSMDQEPFARGINSIQLWFDGGRWWVMSVLWDWEGGHHPIPPELREKA